MTKRPERSVFFAGPGWYEFDPVEGPVQVAMTDPRVVKAKELKAKFLPGNDLVGAINEQLEAEVLRLTRDLEVKDDNLIGEQTKVTNLIERNESLVVKLAASKALQVQAELDKTDLQRQLSVAFGRLEGVLTECAEANGKATQLAEQLATVQTAPPTASTTDPAEVTQLREEVRIANEEITTLRAAKADLEAASRVNTDALDEANHRLDAMTTARNNALNEKLTAEALVATRDTRIAELERERATATATGVLTTPVATTPDPRIAAFEAERDDLRNEVIRLNGLLSARPPAPTVPPITHPVARSSRFWRVVRATSLIAAGIAIAWYGKDYFVPVADQQIAAIQSELQTCSANLAHANEVQESLVTTLGELSKFTDATIADVGSLQKDLTAAEKAKLDAEASAALALRGKRSAENDRDEKGIALDSANRLMGSAQAGLATANAQIISLKGDLDRARGALAEAKKPDDPLKLWPIANSAKRRQIIQTACQGRVKWEDVDALSIEKVLETYGVEKARALLATCDITQLLKDARAYIEEPEPKAEVTTPPASARSCDKPNRGRCIKAL